MLDCSRRKAKSAVAPRMPSVGKSLCGEAGRGGREGGGLLEFRHGDLGWVYLSLHLGRSPGDLGLLSVFLDRVKWEGGKGIRYVSPSSCEKGPGR